MPRAAQNRLSQKGRGAIVKAARRRWRAYRKALKAGDWRRAKKLVGRR